MKAFRVDPAVRAVRPVDLTGAPGAGLRRHVGSDDLDFGSMGWWRDILLSVAIAGDGYYRPELAWWRFGPYPNPLAGAGVIFAADREGVTVDVPLTIEEVIAAVAWLDAKPELPPIVAGGVTIDLNGPDAPKTQAEAFARIAEAMEWKP